MINGEHEVVVCVEDILEALLEVDKVDSEDDDGFVFFVVAKSVGKSFIQSFDGILVKVVDDRVAMVVDNIFESIDDFLFIEFGHIDMFEDELVADPISRGMFTSHEFDDFPVPF